MTRVTGKPVDQIMRTYVDQTGAPVLSVRDSCGAGSTELDADAAALLGDAEAAAPRPRRRRRGRCRCASSSGSGAALRAVKDADADVPRCRAAAAHLHQRREPRLLLLRVHAGGRAGAWPAPPPALKAAERVSLVGDEWRMVRAGRHDIGTYLDLAGAWCRRRHAVGDRRRGRRASAPWRRRWPTPNQRAAYKAWIRADSVRCSTSLGLPGRADDPDGMQGRRATLLTLLGDTATMRRCTARAQALAEHISTTAPRSRPRSSAPVLHGRGRRRRCALSTTATWPSSPATRATPEEFYRFLNALACVPRSRARHPHARVRAVDARSARRTRRR